MRCKRATYPRGWLADRMLSHHLLAAASTRCRLWSVIMSYSGGRGYGGGGGGGGGRGGGRGWYYKQKYGGGRGRQGGSSYQEREPMESYEEPSTSYSRSSHPQASTAPPPAGSRGSLDQLQRLLQQLEGKPYPAYKDARGGWSCASFTIILDHVQGDPYAAPSKLRVQLPADVAGFPDTHLSSKVRCTAVADYLTRQLAAAANTVSAQSQNAAAGWHGVKGGDVQVDMPGQLVLERTSVLLAPDGRLEARFTVGLPARGRSIMGEWAAQILTDHLPRAVEGALRYSRQDAAALWRHVTTVEDSADLRQQLPGLGLLAFVADGSILPRRSGVDDRPMPGQAATLFQSPPSHRVTVQLPHRGTVTGMGLPRGIVLIVGGGYHGKSTLLEALQVGVYDKVPDDGRELVVTVPDAVKVRAEDGRRVAGCNISPFINNLPGGRDTSCFSSDDASGSTSQAASVQELLEVGATCLLMDEDTCATNFMMRDVRMAALVSADKEPITPFVQQISCLRQQGVSTILVMGGSGDYFECADLVLSMDCYRPQDVTATAKEVAARYKPPGAEVLGQGGAADAAGVHPLVVTPRVPAVVCPNGDAGVKINTRGLHLVQLGALDLQLSALEQLVDKSQTRSIAEALRWLQAKVAAAGRTGAQRLTLQQLMQEFEAAVEERGLDALTPSEHLMGNLARPRVYELAAALNRLRSLQVRQAPPGAF